MVVSSTASVPITGVPDQSSGKVSAKWNSSRTLPFAVPNSASSRACSRRLERNRSLSRCDSEGLESEGCQSPTDTNEDTACDDGINNDSDIDFDGGQLI